LPNNFGQIMKVIFFSVIANHPRCLVTWKSICWVEQH
jgi:hypothetical protein